LQSLYTLQSLQEATNNEHAIGVTRSLTRRRFSGLKANEGALILALKVAPRQTGRPRSEIRLNLSSRARIYDMTLMRHEA
jgi:hypothetical protein